MTISEWSSEYIRIEIMYSGIEKKFIQYISHLLE